MLSYYLNAAEFLLRLNRKSCHTPWKMKSAFGYMMKWQVAANSAHAPDWQCCWMLTGCQLLKIYLSIDLFTDLIHPLCQCQTQAWFLIWKLVQKASLTCAKSLSQVMTTATSTATVTVTEIAPDDDDEWVLIVNYKSSACSDLWFSFSCLVLSGWCQPSYEELSHDSLADRGRGCGRKVLRLLLLLHMSNIQIAHWPLFLVFWGLPADICMAQTSREREREIRVHWV